MVLFVALLLIYDDLHKKVIVQQYCFKKLQHTFCITLMKIII